MGDMFAEIYPRVDVSVNTSARARASELPRVSSNLGLLPDYENEFYKRVTRVGDLFGFCAPIRYSIIYLIYVIPMSSPCSFQPQSLAFVCFVALLGKRYHLQLRQHSKYEVISQK